MPKVRQFFDGLLKDRAAGSGLFGPKAARLLNCGQAIGLAPGTILTAVGLVLIGVLGWINLYAVRGLRFEFIYLLGCALVGWAAGARGAWICALASGVCLHLAETASAGGARPGWLYAGNSLVRLLAFAAVGWLGAEAGRVNPEAGADPGARQCATAERCRGAR